MRKLFIVARAWLAILALAGCAGNMQLYRGPKRAEPEISLLRGTDVSRGPLGRNYSTILIAWVDGTHVQAPNMKANTVTVLPGKHVFRIGAYNPRSQCYAQFSADMLAGHVYEVRFTEPPSANGVGPMAIQHAWLQDTTTNTMVQTIDDWEPTERAVWNLPLVIHA